MRRARLLSPLNNAAWERWNKEAAAENQTLVRAYEAAVQTSALSQFAPQISKALYKGCRAFLNGLFSFKCAYCESPTQATQKYIDVEHFRPKLAVAPYRFKARKAESKYDYLLSSFVDAPPPMFGYFWLAYDIANLLPSCIACNRYLKKTLFPVYGGASAPLPRLFVGQPSDHPENRMIVSPYFDDPNEHFAFDDPKGFVRPLSPQGVMTIDVLKLNRDDLPARRKDAIELAIKRFEDWVNAMLARDRDATRVREQVLDGYLEGRWPYSTAARTHIGIREECFAQSGVTARTKWGIWPSELILRLPP